MSTTATNAVDNFEKYKTMVRNQKDPVFERFVNELVSLSAKLNLS